MVPSFMNLSHQSERNHCLLHTYDARTQHFTVLRRVTNQPLRVDVLLFSCCLGETRRVTMLNILKILDKPVSFQ